MIRRLALFKGGQPIRSDGPQTHFSKAGTPTMGGALILLTVLASVLLWGDLRNRYVWLVLVVMVGLRRDRLVRRLAEDRQARSQRHEVALEVPAAVAVRPGRGLVPLLHRRRAGGDHVLHPVLQDGRAAAGGVSFVAIAYFWIVGFSNAVNLTDGLDGLAIMPTVLVACALGVFAYASGNAVFSDLPADPAGARARASW